MQRSESKEAVEKVIRQIRATSPESDIAKILASLDKINHRLDKLESATLPRSEFDELQLAHPSQDRFEIAEAIADAIFAGTNEKACTFEPNGKPCDHCSMCSSRGF